MAIYHFSAKVIGRAAGRSAVGAAAYRSGSALIDERLGIVQDFSDKDDVIHSEVLLPKARPSGCSTAPRYGTRWRRSRSAATRSWRAR